MACPGRVHRFVEKQPVVGAHSTEEDAFQDLCVCWPALSLYAARYLTNPAPKPNIRIVARCRHTRTLVPVVSTLACVQHRRKESDIDVCLTKNNVFSEFEDLRLGVLHNTLDVLRTAAGRP